MVMERIPIVASIDELPNAIEFGERAESSRWYIMRRATVLKAFDKIPKHWYQEPVTASALVASAEPALTQTDVVDAARTSLLDYTSGLTEMDALTASIGEIVWAASETGLDPKSGVTEVIQAFTAAGRLEENETTEIVEALTAAARYVRTPEGAEFYGQPIGSVIVPNVYLPIGSIPFNSIRAGDFFEHELADGTKLKVRADTDADVQGGQTVVTGTTGNVSSSYTKPSNEKVKVYKSAPKGAKAVLSDDSAPKATLSYDETGGDTPESNKAELAKRRDREAGVAFDDMESDVKDSMRNLLTMDEVGQLSTEDRDEFIGAVKQALSDNLVSARMEQIDDLIEERSESNPDDWSTIRDQWQDVRNDNDLLKIARRKALAAEKTDDFEARRAARKADSSMISNRDAAAEAAPKSIVTRPADHDLSSYTDDQILKTYEQFGRTDPDYGSPIALAVAQEILKRGLSKQAVNNTTSKPSGGGPAADLLPSPTEPIDYDNWPLGAPAPTGDASKDAAILRLFGTLADRKKTPNEYALTPEEDEALKTGEVPELKPAPASTAFVDNATRSLGTINPGAKGNDPERFTPKETFADGTTPAAGQKIRDKKGRTGVVQETYQAYTAVRWDDTSKVQTVKNDRLNATGGAAPSVASTDAAGKAGETTTKAIDNSPTTDTGGAAELPDSKPAVDPLSKVKRVKTDPIGIAYISDRIGSDAKFSYEIKGADGSTVGYVQRGYDQSNRMSGSVRVGRNIDRRGWLAFDKTGRLMDQSGKTRQYLGYMSHPDIDSALETVKKRFADDAPKITPPVPAPPVFDVNAVKQGDTVRVNLNDEIREGSRTINQDMMVVNPNGGDKIQVARPNGSLTWISRSEVVGMGTGAPAVQGDLVPRVYDPVYPTGRPMPTRVGDVDTGDIVLVDIGEGPQYILLEEISDDIKNGEPGWSGRSVNADGTPNYDRYDKWGYADQITRIQSKGAAKPAVADNTVTTVAPTGNLSTAESRMLNLMLRPRAKTAGRAALLKKASLEELQARYRSAYNSSLHTQDDYNAWASIVNAIRKEILARGAKPDSDGIRYTGQN